MKEHEKDTWAYKESVRIDCKLPMKMKDIRMKDPKTGMEVPNPSILDPVVESIYLGAYGDPPGINTVETKRDPDPKGNAISGWSLGLAAKNAKNTKNVGGVNV